MTINAADIRTVTRAVTKEWTKQRKAEDRGRSRGTREYVYSDRVVFMDVADSILPEGYAHASGDGRYTVDKRQLYYAVRDQFLEETGREITADYFSQTLLVKYMNRNPEETGKWKITASPRGTISIPNTGHDTRIPCGTIAVQQLLAKAAKPCDPFVDNVMINVAWPSHAENQRYQAVVYIEKEGFDPQLREARIAERFDVAIVSCKGQSVVAARMFADQACRSAGGVPLIVFHDMDKAGFEISQRLTTISDHARENDLVKYEFRNDINVTDAGLRLVDVEKYNLKSERCRLRGSFPHDTIATQEEQDFLQSNRRVELNAFTAPQFIEWMESKLADILKKRLVPTDEILEAAYRRCLVVRAVNLAIMQAREESIPAAMKAKLPKSIRQELQRRLSFSTAPWDQTLYDIMESKLFQDGDQ